MEQIAALFSNNLINCFILVIFLIYLWARLTPPMFAARKNKIETALQEAAQARIEGQEFFKQQEARLAEAGEEAGKILAQAQELAASLKAEIEAQAARETKALSERVSQQIAAEYQQAVMDLRKRAAEVAVKLAEKTVPAALNESTNSRLLAEFVQELDKGGFNK
jgi:F-type H+-transporting ATPase subunit b